MRRSILITAAIAALVVSPATSSSATEPAAVTGCPASNQVLVVADLSALGYRVPAQVDSEGNANGLVCAKPFNPVVQARVCEDIVCAGVLYRFRDDDLTP
ncbi:hypothetical protein [Microbacterium pumilum]|uniref:Uncharacterized protein n=1 Tax=Microbacterium pumilum TaxID=344165 RepID=A0ABP5EHL8_9MICO